MRLGPKIILVVLPIIVATVLIAGLSSAFSAQNGITRIAVEALGFKAQELEKYAESQWALLVDNDLAENQEYVDVTKRAVESYARSLIRSDSELIFAVDPTGEIAMATNDISVSSPSEREAMRIVASRARDEWREITVQGFRRVGQTFLFEPFEWLVLVTDTEDNFYAEVDSIRLQTYVIVGIAALVAIVLIAIFTRVLTGPLLNMVDVMQEITETSDLSQRVEVRYRDEIGAMAKRFNGMLAELQSANENLKGAYDKVKEQAYRAEVAQWKEFRIRSMFQRYVPKDVIDRVAENPESALTGETRILAIFFSDIRSFTTISETLTSDVVVESLNRYFALMVPIIKRHKGIVDKYIGDAIMAFFGAPVKHENDSLEAVSAALEMLDVLPEFNEKQKLEGLPEFRIGVGIEYGGVTVGNIGCDDKMDYTIIGDKVNSGSRLEGLNKEYHQQLIFSRAVFSRVKGDVACRLVDAVQVKGRKTGEDVYTAVRNQTPVGHKAWGLYHSGIKRYRQRQFADARKYFVATTKLIPGDYLALRYIQRCDAYLSGELEMPGEDWNFVTIMHRK
jgi:adenylate cyclase